MSIQDKVEHELRVSAHLMNSYDCSHGQAKRIMCECLVDAGVAEKNIALVENRTHYIDGQCGPAYRAVFTHEGETYTAMVSVEFGMEAVDKGDQPLSNWI